MLFLEWKPKRPLIDTEANTKQFWHNEALIFILWNFEKLEPTVKGPEWFDQIKQKKKLKETTEETFIPSEHSKC